LDNMGHRLRRSEEQGFLNGKRKKKTKITMSKCLRRGAHFGKKEDYALGQGERGSTREK